MEARGPLVLLASDAEFADCMLQAISGASEKEDGVVLGNDQEPSSNLKLRELESDVGDGGTAFSSIPSGSSVSVS
jgi:hypothetical protein